MYFQTSGQDLSHQALQFLPIMKRIYNIMSDKISNRLGKRNPHFIYRYLSSVPLYEEGTSQFTYIMKRNLELMEYVKLYGLWHDLMPGETMENVFFSDTPEIFISLTTPLKPSYMDKDLEPISIVYAPSLQNYIPPVPDSSRALPESVVYTVQLPMIALMYSNWVNKRRSREDYEDIVIKPERFIQMELFPKIMKACMNVFMFNVVPYYALNGEVPDLVNQETFSLPDPRNKAVEWLEAYLRKNNKTKRKLGDYLEQIPTIDDSNFYNILENGRIPESDTMRVLMLPIYVYYNNILTSLFPEAARNDHFTRNKIKLNTRLLMSSRGRHLLNTLPEDIQMNML